MFKTEFGGLTVLEAGEPLSTDGYSFQTVNPLLTDRLLKLGARTHRHDEHPPISGPIDAPVLTLTSNGSLPADADIAIAYTLVDTDGGETLVSPTALVTTAPPIEAPDGAPITDTSETGGHLVAGTYTYALTLTDPNGETTAGAPFFANVPPGTDTNVILISGLSDIVAASDGATGWRLYKSSSVGQLHFLAAGGASLDEVSDDGMLCADCAVTPPTVNSTAVAQGLQVTIPDTVTNQATGVAAYRIYASVGGSFLSPSYVEQRTDFGTVIDYTDLVVNAGAPPDVSLSFGGAQKIDPDTEILDWHWKRPVATMDDLPMPSEEGDVRVVTDDGSIHIYANATWVPFTAAAMNWMPPVLSITYLPNVGNVLGDVRMTMDSRSLYAWLETGSGTGWVPILQPPHEIWNGETSLPMPQRVRLTFMNSDLSDDALNNATVVTPKGGGGGGLPSQLQMGDAIQWVDSNGIVQLSLTGSRLTRDSVWFTEEFDSGLPGWVNVGGVFQSDGDYLVPAPGITSGVDHYTFKGVYAHRDCEIGSYPWVMAKGSKINALAVGLFAGSGGDIGFMVRLTEQGTFVRIELVYRKLATDPWSVLDTADLDEGAIVDDDEVGMRFRRSGPMITYDAWNITQGGASLHFGEDIAVPAAMLNFSGAPGIMANVAAPDAFKLGYIEGLVVTEYFQLSASSPSAGHLLAETEDHRVWKGNPGTLATGWSSSDLMARWNEDKTGLEFKGRITKDTDTNPAVDEVIFTLDTAMWQDFYGPYNADYTVATGDADGVETGIIRWLYGSVTWKAGRSSDPTVKQPYVSFNGLAVPA